jgi:hypothetical protein
VRTHSQNALAVIVCLLFVCAAPAFPRGSPEAGLKEVEALIAARDYSAAQKLLVEIRRKNPELVDPTQALLDQVMAHEREYNGLKRQLLDAIDRKDIEAAEELIARMEESDPHKQLAFEKAQVKDLLAARGVGAYMDRVAALLDKGHYAEAIAAYLAAIDDPAVAGFSGPRDAFLATRDAALYVTGVQNTLSSIRAAAQAAAALDGEVRGVAAAVQSLPAGSAPGKAASDFAAAAAPLVSLSAREAELRGLADRLAGILKALQSPRRGAAEDLYPRYMLMLARGRDDRVEGILGAVHLLWEAAAGDAARVAVELASAGFDAALKVYDGASRSADPAALAAAAGPFLPAGYRSIAAVEAGKLLASAGWEFTPSNREELSGLRAAALASRESADESAAFLSLIELERTAAALPPVDRASVDARRASQQLAVRADSLRMEWASRADGWPAQAGPGMDGAALAKAAGQMAERFAAVAGKARERDLGYAVALAAGESAGFEGRYAVAAAARQRGEDDLNGTRGGKPPGPEEVIPRFPARALDSLESARAGFETLARDAQAWKARWGADLPAVVQSPGMRALAAQADDMLERTGRQAAEIAAVTARAQEVLFAAEKNRRDAESAFAEATRALARQELDNARELAGNRATSLFIASLNLEENAQARARLDPDIPNLLRRIEQARYERDVRAVDALIDEAIALFRRERFLDARLRLDEARDKWRAMPEGQKGAYDLLEEWYARVLAALAVSGDRVLAANDPRLDVISPLMSRANELFAQAEKLAAEAEQVRKSDPRDPRIREITDRRDALLGQARTHVSSVLSVAAGYAEARLLALRIQRLADPAAFQRSARDEVGKAVASGLARTATNVAQKDALNTLTDYEKVVEDRTLRATITDALRQLQEKVYGWKLPTTEEIAQAAALLAEAQRRFRPADPATFDPALTRVNSAIAITGRALPEQAQAKAVNKAARDLRERILNLRQAQSITVTTLTRKDQETFAAAQELLNSGGEQNELRSWDLIQPLLAKYKDFQPLNRMEAVLKARLRL